MPAARRAPELGGFVLGVHDKHRERVRRRFDEAGDKFEDYQLLELPLFYSIPRIDTNPIAHELINRFGSLRAVLDASPEQLTCVKGVGASSATLIKLVRSAARRISARRRGAVRPGQQREHRGHAGAALLSACAKSACISSASTAPEK